MDKFNKSRGCVKCGLIATDDKLVNHTYYSSRFPYEKTIEVIQRTCNRCGYGWRELPLDTKEDVTNRNNDAICNEGE